MGKARGHRISSPRLLGALALACACALVPSVASAHIERASYWPDPAPDASVSPPAGGAVPAARSLFTALDPAPPGDTRVVCQGTVPKYPAKRISRQRRLFRGAVERRKVRRLKRSYARKVNKNTSIARLRGFVQDARANGYRYRPLGDHKSFSKADAKALTVFNKRLLRRCHFDSIQDAVNASHNNDRVVVMPGIYTEPKSRAAPTFDPKCDGLEEMNDRPGGGGSLQT
jgi:RNase P protein component